MTRFRASVVLLLVQLLLVLSVAGKYLYERKTRPRIWSRATQYDLNQSLRGRYLALQLLVDACALPRDQAHYTKAYRLWTGGGEPTEPQPGSWKWNVSLQVSGGRLVPILTDHPKTPSDAQQLELIEGKSCDRVPLRSEEEFFVPEHVSRPFPLKPGQELWVEVTMPSQGPPRPIQLALYDASGFHNLR